MFISNSTDKFSKNINKLNDGVFEGVEYNNLFALFGISLLSNTLVNCPQY